MNFDLTPEQQRVQAAARQFAAQEVAPIAREADETGSFPHHLVRRMGELGFLGGPIEPEYGGAGMDYVSYALLCEELGRADSSVRGFLTVHTSLVSLCIRDWGTEEQKRRYLPRLATGEIIGCYALTEPNAGSDAASLEATVLEDGDSYLLNGEKFGSPTAPARTSPSSLPAGTAPPGIGASAPSSLKLIRPASAANPCPAKNWATAPRNTRISSSKTAVCPQAPCSARRAKASRSPCPRWIVAAWAWLRARLAWRKPAWTPALLSPRSAASSASASPISR
ncbi:MAG TPA: acyl-CoA dehydrogenase family protein [Ktedonobacterales bacterium]